MPIVKVSSKDQIAILKDEFAPLLRASEEALRTLWENPEDDVWDDV